MLNKCLLTLMWQNYYITICILYLFVLLFIYVPANHNKIIYFNIVRLRLYRNIRSSFSVTDCDTENVAIQMSAVFFILCSSFNISSPDCHHHVPSRKNLQRPSACELSLRNIFSFLHILLYCNFILKLKISNI